MTSPGAPFARLRRALPLTATVLAALLLAACAGGGAVSHRYYLIDPATFEPLPASTSPTVEILDVALPQYLERFQLTTRIESNELRISETHQWAENLRKNLLRTLARNLGQLLDTPAVGTPLGRNAARPDVRVQVNVEAFERAADGHVVLAARWQLVLDDPPRVRTERADLRSTSPVAADDYPAIVAAMQARFGELSERIARSITATGNDA